MSTNWVTDAHIDRLSETMAGLVAEAESYRASETGRNEDTEYFEKLNRQIREDFIREKLMERGVTDRMSDEDVDTLKREILTAIDDHMEDVKKLASASDASSRRRIADALLGAIVSMLLEAVVGLVPEGMGGNVVDAIIDVITCMG